MDIFDGAQRATLEQVLTVSEVRRMWRKSQTAVMMAIFKGQIIARNTAYKSVWLVSRPSVVELWGQPLEEIKDDAY